MSWWQLLDIRKQRAEEFAYWAERPPVACPRDGEPLRNAPPNAASGIEFYCPFDGWAFPRDWITPQQL